MANWQVATLASPENGSVAVVVLLPDVLGRAHLVEPLADRKVATVASQEHGSAAPAVRLGDVLIRASTVQPFA